MTQPAPAPAPAPAPPVPAPAPGPQYAPPESQEALDRIVEQRLSRERAKYSDYDDLKAKAARADQLEADLGSESDKAAKKARDEERAKADAEWAPRAVRAEFRAAAKGVLTDAQLDALLEDLDLTKYVTSKGDVDEDKVTKKVAALAPAGTSTPAGPRSLGQGAQPPANAKKGDAGLAMAQKRFPKVTTGS